MTEKVLLNSGYKLLDKEVKKNDKKTIKVEIPILDNVDQMKVVETFTEEQLWYVCAIAKAFDKLQSNWNSLRELIKWRPIEEYDENKYDWVLVKYYDGDYECVPEVAEKRSDGKWYTSEKEIPFEVKYFFDMQELLEERN